MSNPAQSLSQHVGVILRRAKNPGYRGTLFFAIQVGEGESKKVVCLQGSAGHPDVALAQRTDKVEFTVKDGNQVGEFRIIFP